MMATILQGDCIERLRELPDESVHCCVTSPPYWGLRDYGVAGQIGLEATPAEYVAKMVAVFAEVWRVLRGDGTAWVNLGDCYIAAPQGPNTNSCGLEGSRNNMAAVRQVVKLRKGKDQDPKRAAAAAHSPLHHASFRRDRAAVGNEKHRAGGGLRPKNLVGIPWRVAFALQADGWYLRSDIIWHKPNPMPESVTDRPTKSHEYIFLLSKSERYYYDAGAISEPVSESMMKQVEEGYEGHATKLFEIAGAQNGSDTKRRIIEGARAKLTNGKHSRTPEQSSGNRIVESVANARAGGAPHDNPFGLTRNKRTVWTVNTAPCKEAHFATFPPDLIKPCILAGCPVGGTVLDPFGGSGTTGMVALELGRKAILIELNPDYIELADQRCNVTPGLPLQTNP